MKKIIQLRLRGIPRIDSSGIANYESRLLPLHVTLVCQGTLQRRQRTAYSKLQDKVFSYWDGYNNKKMGAFLLLKKCAEIYGHE